MNTGAARSLWALALQCAALAALAAALLGVSWLDTRGRAPWLVLLDRSDSVPRAAGDAALAEVARAAKAAGRTLQALEFAARPASAPGGAAARLDSSATDIEAALDAALAAHARAAYAGAVVVSDGLENVGDAARALRAAQDARLPVQWLAVGRAPPPTRIVQVLAPDRALAGQQLRVEVQLAGPIGPALRVRASARASSGQTQTALATPDAGGRTTLAFDTPRSGALLVDVVLEDGATAQALDRRDDAAVVDVAPRAPLLYVNGGDGALARSLRRGGWSLDLVPATRLDGLADGLEGVRAVVLDDVAVADAGPRFWTALVSAVRTRGLGLLVLGGERSFARGGYRGSALESVLPLRAEPPALDEPAAVVFAVDKSGSMGQGSSGVDRFALAQRAVIETARGLGERDALGLVVFDVEPRTLLPLGPAAAGQQALARDWQATPSGGTRLLPALQAAIAELEGSSASRRMLVVVTDGFVDEAPLAGLRARLAKSRIEIVALAVGADADAGALERLVGPEDGLVLRVDQAAELPQVMRSGLERRRARVERGAIAVEQRQPLPFTPGTLRDWPAVAAYQVTRPQPQAVVAVQSARGDPLLAFQQSGLGRVVALPGGFGRWAPAWWSWREGPRLAGGLADWVGGAADGMAPLSVHDEPNGLRIEADLPGGAAAAEGAPIAVTVDTPAARGVPLALANVAPGRLSATLPEAGPGLYAFAVTTAQGTRRQLHLRRHRAEAAAWGTSPALAGWKAAGLVTDWDPARPLPARAGTTGDDPAPDRSLLALALLLFGAGVLVDRTRPSVAALRAVLLGWRQRLRARA